MANGHPDGPVRSDGLALVEQLRWEARQFPRGSVLVDRAIAQDHRENAHLLDAFDLLDPPASDIRASSPPPGMRRRRPGTRR